MDNRHSQWLKEEVLIDRITLKSCNSRKFTEIDRFLTKLNRNFWNNNLWWVIQWEYLSFIIKSCLKSYYWGTTGYSSIQLFYSLTQHIKDGASLTLPKTPPRIQYNTQRNILTFFVSFDLEFFFCYIL